MKEFLRKVLKFLDRDIVNSVMLCLTVVFAIISIVTESYIGFLYILLSIFIFRFMVWHYRLWDKIDRYIMDDEIRVNVFSLQRKSDTVKRKRNKAEDEVISSTVLWILLSLVILYGAYLVCELIFLKP